MILKDWRIATIKEKIKSSNQENPKNQGLRQCI